MVKTIIAGSRTITDKALVEQAVMESGFHITEVVSGGAKGVDRLGIRWANQHNVPYVILFASWTEHGNSAGPIRNKEMAEYAEALILVWDGKSKGSQSMLDIAKKMNLKIYEKVVQ